MHRQEQDAIQNGSAVNEESTDALKRDHEVEGVYNCLCAVATYSKV